MSKHKSFVISGASSGLGLAISQIMSVENEVTILSRNCPKNLDKKINHISIDFSKKENILKLTELQKQRIINADILINNVGVFSDSSTEPLKGYDYLDLFSVNVFSAIELTKLYIEKRQFGRIININSVSGIRAQKNQEYYSASKFALRGFFDSLAQNINPNIKITNIYSAGIDTPLWDKHLIREDLRANFMDPLDVAGFIKSIVDLPKSISLKELHIQPLNEWNF